MKGNYLKISNTFMFLVCDVITWRHKGKTIKYRPFRRSKWQTFYNHSCVIHQMKDIYSEISNIFKFLIYDVITWRHKGKTTKYRRFRRLKWQQLCNYSRVLHQIKGLYSEISIMKTFFCLWRHHVTSQRKNHHISLFRSI